MMRLFIQTSSGEYDVAVASDTEVLATSRGLVPTTRSRDVAEHLRHSLEAADCDICDIGSIAADVGPGGLAATRSGVAFANGLAYSLSCPVVGVGFFDLLHADLLSAGVDGRILCVRLGPAGQLFWSEYYDDVRGPLRICDAGQFRSYVASQSSKVTVAGNTRILGETLDGLPVDIIPKNHASMSSFFKAGAGSQYDAESVSIIRPLSEVESVAGVRA